MDIQMDNSLSDFIKKENTNRSTNTFLGCYICGENHNTEKCSVLDNIVHVQDKKVPPRAYLTLPMHLKVETLADGTKTVIATKLFAKGSQFGPYRAKHLYSMNPFDTFPLKIFGDLENILPDYYLDTGDEEQCNWMCYIAPAQNLDEQNLICYQIKLDIYYSVIRDIQPGEQLRVWYSYYYAYKMGVEVYTSKPSNTASSLPTAADYLNDAERIERVAEKLPASKLGAEEKQHWCCKMCGHVETHVVHFAKHLQTHYIHMIRNSYVCDICRQGYSSEKCLLKHKKETHIVLSTVLDNIQETKSNQQESDPINPQRLEISKATGTELNIMEPLELTAEDSLMNDTLTEPDGDQLDDNPNTLQLFDQLNLSSTGLYNDLNDVDTLRAILCDDNTKASKTAQEKSIADFSLELVETQHHQQQLGQTVFSPPPYICDICNKSFQNLRYLCRHLKKHTGELTCLQCLYVFTRKENYLRHRCFLSENLSKQFNCSFCGKSFRQHKYLRRHMARHLHKHACTKCGNNYASRTEKEHHNCSAIPENEKTTYACDICKQTFYRKLYLKKHKRTCHTKDNTCLEQSADINSQSQICEICAEEFKSVASLKQHMLQHSEPRFTCAICSKKFYRMDVYSNHLLSHGTAQIPCTLCAKNFKTKKSLATHMLQHTGEKRFQCDECGREYFQRSNMIRHRLKHHSDNLSENNKEKLQQQQPKQSLNILGGSIHKCSICGKEFAKSHLLNRHIIHIHTDKVYKCPYCNNMFKYRNSIRRHLQRNHVEMKSEWSDPRIITTFLKDRDEAEQEIISTRYDDSVVGTSASAIVTTAAVSSTTLDQQITLGKNAFILEDGIIVQPQDEGNIMFYVLQQSPLPQQPS